MAYTDVNTPVIEKITLPSGNSYNIADRLIRNSYQDLVRGSTYTDYQSTPIQDQIKSLAQTIAGGVSFIISWNGTTAPVVSNIPLGVVVTYNGTNYTGTFDPNNATPGAFYLVKSSTSPSSETLDLYDEYIVMGPDGSKMWEKIGDTKLNLTDVVTNVTLSKSTDTVIGTESTFTVTQPTITMSTVASGGVSVLNAASTKRMTATASGGNVTANKTNIKATASGGSVTSSGNTAVLTGLGSPSTQSAVKSVTPTTKKLATTTVTGVSGSTTPNVVQGRTSQTTANGSGTASTTNTDWLKGVSVSGNTLVIGAATMNTQTTYSANAPGTITVPTAAASATTVATGSTTTTGSGADIVTDVSVGDTFNAVTGYASPTTTNALTPATTFTMTQPTIALATGATAGTGVISVATDIGTVTQPTITLADTATSGGVQFVQGTTSTQIKGTATGGNVAWNNKDSVTALTSASSITVTKGS